MKVNDFGTYSVNSAQSVENLNNVNNSNNIKKDNQKKNSLNSIYAGDLNLCRQDTIDDKRKQAKNMAMNMIMNAFSGDKDIDKEVSERKAHIEEKRADSRECREMLNDIANERSVLKEEYGIEDGGKEDGELELLRKSKNPQSALNMTDEEKQKLSEIRTRGISDYQTRMLELDVSAKEFSDRIYENKKSIIEDNAIVRGIGIERLKSHAMVDATNQADEIMKTASREIVSMVVNDGKDKIDADRAEREEKAEEKKAKEKELEEKIEAARARAEETRKQSSADDNDIMYKADELMDEIERTAQANKVESAQKSLNLMVGELALTADDLKGAAVDEKM